MDSMQSSCARIVSTEIGSALTVGSRRASTGKLHNSWTMVRIREASHVCRDADSLGERSVCVERGEVGDWEQPNKRN
jgi:hypothetical protein